MYVYKYIFLYILYLQRSLNFNGTFLGTAPTTCSVKGGGECGLRHTFSKMCLRCETSATRYCRHCSCP